MSERKVLFPVIAIIAVVAIISAFVLTPVVAVVVVIALIVLGGLTFVYLPMVLPRGTSIVVSPTSFTLASGESMALTATPKSGGLTLTGAGTTWVASVGSFDRTTGSVVIYKVPEVAESTTVAITASFPGERPYRPSKATINGTVMPKKVDATPASPPPTTRVAETTVAAGPKVPASDLRSRASTHIAGTVAQASIKEFAYEMRFGRLVVNNAELRGPITMLGVNVVEIAGSLANVSKLALDPLGLNAPSASFDNFRMYATRAKAYSTELGKELELTGDQETKMSMGTLTLENGAASIIYLTGTSVELTKPELLGKRKEGSEQYTPVIATAHKVTLEQGYAIQGPTTFETLVNEVNNLSTGKIVATDFTFTCPLDYSLDKESKEYSYKTKWTMSASGLTGQNPSIHFVYFATTYAGFVLKGIGDQSASTIIPHGFSSGWKSPPLPDAQVHAVHFSSDQLTLKDLVIQITP
jgi:hypothetical protein